MLLVLRISEASIPFITLRDGDTDFLLKSLQLFFAGVCLFHFVRLPQIERVADIFARGLYL